VNAGIWAKSPPDDEVLNESLSPFKDTERLWRAGLIQQLAEHIFKVMIFV